MSPGLLNRLPTSAEFATSMGCGCLLMRPNRSGTCHCLSTNWAPIFSRRRRHKGLLGPLGTGVLYIRPGLEAELDSIRQGGTGTQSQDDRQPESLPDKYEVGNHNVPGLVGLAAALEWIAARGINQIWQHEQQLAVRLREGLEQIAGVQLHASKPQASASSSLGVVSISIEGYDPQEASALLDSEFGVQVRAGLHCAPNVHRAMGTLDRGGTVRFSLGAFNSVEDVDAAVAAVREIASGV